MEPHETGPAALDISGPNSGAVWSQTKVVAAVVICPVTQGNRILTA